MKGTTLCLALASIGLVWSHRTDRILGTCPSGWDEAGYICYKYNHGERDLKGALEECHDMAKHYEIDQHFTEDESLLLTIGKLYEFIRDGHIVTNYFHHTVRLNAVKSNGKWWEIQKLPSGHFHYEDVSKMLGHVQEITGGDAVNVGFGLDQVAALGEDGDGLIFNPGEQMIKIADADFDFPYVCTHKRENRPGGRCPGAVAECNDRGNCFYGLCECRDGYSPETCFDPFAPLPGKDRPCIEIDIDYFGSDFQVIDNVGSAFECWEYCRTTGPRCGRFTWTSPNFSNPSKCFLKEASTANNPSDLAEVASGLRVNCL